MIPMEPYNISDPFDIAELEYALSDKSNSATGMDGISYSMFKNLPIKGKIILTRIFNNILRGEPLPVSWRRYNIICLHKPNKDPSLAENYRPIILASCGGKILQIMIKNRLDWFLEHHNLFPNYQWGFRKGKGIYDNVAYLS